MNAKSLYDLLPQNYHHTDGQHGGPLRALMQILQSEYDILEADIQQLYENWFIETCQDWCVPYIGDLVGVKSDRDWSKMPINRRSLVGNTIGYRRRKGTLGTFTNVIKDTTGWDTKVVESYPLLSRTQALNHIQLNQGKTVNVRATQALDLLTTPFNSIAHTGSVRGNPSFSNGTSHLAPPSNSQSVHIYCWRLKSYPRVWSDARKLGETPHGSLYSFHPFGLEFPLFNRPQRLPDAFTVPNLRNLAVLLKRSMCWKNDLPFEIHVPRDGTYVAIPSEKIKIQSLKDKALLDHSGQPDEAVVDPETGRFCLGPSSVGDVKVTYSYGFSADLGGGPYQRSLLSSPPPSPWVGYVSQAPLVDPSQERQRFENLEAAFQAWFQAGGQGTITLCDSQTYRFPSLGYHLQEQQWLALQAAPGQCPCILGNLYLKGDRLPNQVTLDGLWMDGSLNLYGELTLKIHHCTLKPEVISGGPRISLWADQAQQNVEIVQSIVGPIRLPSRGELSVRDSILDGLGDRAIGTMTAHQDQKPLGPRLTIERSTVFGSVATRELTASDTLFRDPIWVDTPHKGYARFSFIPHGSSPPVLYKCVYSQGAPLGTLRFSSMQYGHPAYAQLGQHCSSNIQTGAENGAEMGVYNQLYNPQRQEAVGGCLNEYLPYGLQAEMFFAT